jgi:hypothetical protein
VYLRRSSRTNKDGTTTSYLSLAHNYRDADSGVSKPKILHSFGREDELDPDALQRLMASIARHLDVAVPGGVDDRGPAALDLEPIDGRDLGGVWVLDQLWSKLGIGTEIRKLARSPQASAGPQARRRAAGADPVRARGREGARAVLEARGHPLDPRRGPHRRLGGGGSHLLLPGDGLAARPPRDPAADGVLRGRRPAPARCGPDLLRHHLHLLRDGVRGRRARRHRRRACASGAIRRTRGPTCPRS